MALIRSLITQIFLSISETCSLALAKLSFGAPYTVTIQTSSGAKFPVALNKDNLKTLLKVITAHAFQCVKNGESLPTAQVRNRQKAYDQTVGDEEWYLIDKKMSIAKVLWDLKDILVRLGVACFYESIQQESLPSTDPDSLLLIRHQQRVGCLVCFHRTVLPNRLEVEADTH